ncbi:MAG: hypothetical protein D6701_02085 [Gemmatimonadetes bacterium]|nr:MAG: hypothetical protein D6701_02085 [Gemmatimonadota bacterium]
MRMDRKTLRNTGIAVLGVAAAGWLAAAVVRNRMDRHSRDLFSPRFLRRLAALGHIAREPATVDNITLLRDYAAWESRRSLRRRARAVLARMEAELEQSAAGA